jgi:hypothetical protein
MSLSLVWEGTDMEGKRSREVDCVRRVCWVAGVMLWWLEGLRNVEAVLRKAVKRKG